MSRRALLVRFVAALVGIVAVAVAATTITSPSDRDSIEGEGVGSGADGGGEFRNPTDVQPPASGDFPPLLEYLVALFLVLVAVVGTWYLITHRRDALKIVAITAVALLLASGTAIMFADGDLDMELSDMGTGAPDGGGLGGEPGDQGTSDSIPFDLPITVLALAFAVMIVVGALVVSGKRDEPRGRREPDGEPDPEATAVGAAAGRAADRIDATGEGEAVDNEVYRAWREMTRPLDVDSPETSTPGEFATAAVDAGLAREHADELTRLFEDVRYGDVETTPQMESRAVAVLRRIEEAYAEGAPDRGGEDA